MTLVVVAGNDDFCAQFSDRRLTSEGIPIDDEFNKATIISCANARFAVGFSGLARFGNWDVSKWILNALRDGGGAEHDIKTLIDNFCDYASQNFSKLPALRGVSSRDRRLSVIFSGYLYNHQIPRFGIAIVSNFQNFENGQDDAEAAEKFQTIFQIGKADVVNATLIQRIGAWNVLGAEDIARVRSWLEARIAPAEFRSKMLALFRHLATKSRGIGKQVNSIILPRAIDEDPEAQYHPMGASSTIYFPNWLIRTGVQPAWTVSALQISTQDGTPIVIPRVGKNRPCPCGSKLAYRLCHGEHSWKNRGRRKKR